MRVFIFFAFKFFYHPCLCRACFTFHFNLYFMYSYLKSTVLFFFHIFLWNYTSHQTFQHNDGDPTAQTASINCLVYAAAAAENKKKIVFLSVIFQTRNEKSKPCITKWIVVGLPAAIQLKIIYYYVHAYVWLLFFEMLC